MKRLFFILSFLLFSAAVFACRCTTDSLSVKVLDRYTTILLAKIIRLGEISYGENGNMNYQQADIEPLELFKGKPAIRSILIFGKNTSCDMGVKEGDTWLLFANTYNNEQAVYPCGHSIAYIQQSPSATYYFYYLQGITTLNFLRNQYGKYPANGVYTGKWLNRQQAFTMERRNGKLNGSLVLFNESGKKIAQYSYRDSLLHGEASTWYLNGQLHTRTMYQDGGKDGLEEQYDISGQIRSKRTYHAGKWSGPSLRWDAFGNLEFSGQYMNDLPVDTLRSWYPQDTVMHNLSLTKLLSGDQTLSDDSLYAIGRRKQLDNMTVYDDSGREGYSIHYYRTGELKSVTVTEPNTGYRIRHEYFQNGKTSFFSIYYYVWNREKGYDEIHNIYTEYNLGHGPASSRKYYYNKEGDKVELVTELINGKEEVVYPITKEE